MSMTDRHQQTPTPVRLPDDLKAALKSKATANDRSLNGEVIARLRDSLQADGMTLRDYFAAQFMVRAQSLCETNDGWSMENAAQCAYQMADAMLEARSA